LETANVFSPRAVFVQLACFGYYGAH
jgi:hypothetical protein